MENAGRAAALDDLRAAIRVLVLALAEPSVQREARTQGGPVAVITGSALVYAWLFRPHRPWLALAHPTISGHGDQASTSSITWPCTSVRRRLRPLW